MPLYDVKCSVCGPQEVWKTMADVTGQWKCPKCDGFADRLYTPPADHSENTFREYRSDALSVEKDPVKVGSRAEEKRLFEERGVQRWERGITEEGKRGREDHFARERAKELEKHREPTLRKLYFAKNYGYAPTRG